MQSCLLHMLDGVDDLLVGLVMQQWLAYMSFDG
jgi:hypothetical protein